MSRTVKNIAWSIAALLVGAVLYILCRPDSYIGETRKTAVSLMHGAGIPIETVRIIVGHSGKGVTESVYLFKTPSELVEAINTIKIV